MWIQCNHWGNLMNNQNVCCYGVTMCLQIKNCPHFEWTQWCYFDVISDQDQNVPSDYILNTLWLHSWVYWKYIKDTLEKWVLFKMFPVFPMYLWCTVPFQPFQRCHGWWHRSFGLMVRQHGQWQWLFANHGVFANIMMTSLLIHLPEPPCGLSWPRQLLALFK